MKDAVLVYFAAALGSPFKRLPRQDWARIEAVVGCRHRMRKRVRIRPGDMRARRYRRFRRDECLLLHPDRHVERAGRERDGAGTKASAEDRHTQSIMHVSA